MHWRSGRLEVICEKCWADAYMLMLRDGRPQGEHYHELLAERKDNPCTEQEQRGVARDDEESPDAG